MWNVLHHSNILITLFIVKDHFSLCLTDVTFFCLQLLAFLQGLFTFYHEGYELAHEFEPYKQQLQFNLQNVSPSTSVWMAATLGHDAIVPKRTLEHGAKSQLLLCPFFLSPRPRRLQPEEPNFVFDLKCQHHCCDHLYSNTDLGCKASNSRRWGHLSCSSRENESALIWPLCLDKENFLEPKVMLSLIQ